MQRCWPHHFEVDQNSLTTEAEFNAKSGLQTIAEMTDFLFQVRHNGLSFALANMMATTVFLLFRSFAVQTKYLKPVIVSGLVTFIAAYHYVRIFNWVDAYDYATGFQN